MNIGYIVLGCPKPSIAKKISDQTQSLNQVPGCSARLYIYCHSNPTWGTPQIRSANYIFFPTLNPHPYLRALLFRRKALRDLVQRITKDKLDILYIRGTPSDPFIGRFLKTCPVQVVFEINSIQSYERIMQKKPWVGWFEEYYTRKALSLSDGFVSVSSSARDYYARLVRNSVPNIVQGNGFEVEGVPLRRPPDFDGKHVRLLSVANYAKWHGIDRAIEGLGIYHGSLNIFLTIAGTGALLSDIKQRVKNLRLSKQVSFLGEVYGEKLDSLFNQSHLALGALAIHRKMLVSTSAIKTAEYLSRGIPFLISGGDENLAAMTNQCHYYLQVPQNDSPIDFSILEPVAQRMFADPVLPQQMRDYAIEFVSMEKKMRELVSFFKSLRTRK